MKPKRYCRCWCGALLAPEKNWPENPTRNDMRFKCEHCNSTLIYDDEELESHNKAVKDPAWRHRWETGFKKLGRHNILLIGRFKQVE